MSGMMVLWVKGANSAVAASQRVKYALKDFWSVLHLLASQGSYMMPLSKKTVEAFKRPVTRSCQRALPFVFALSVRRNDGKGMGKYVVIHCGTSKQEDASVVGPGVVVFGSAVVSVLGSVEYLVFWGHETNAIHPIPCLDCPVRVCRVSSI